jgi:crotonobetainyl-CoA:carnitine CoA-transferase CaiB-like acyl-CoA transferase
MAPQGVFPCAGADRWLALTVRHDEDWRRLVGVAADAPWLGDDRFHTAAGRMAFADEIEDGLARWTRGHDARESMHALQNAGIPAGVVLKTDEALHDPHFTARGWFRPLTHPDTGTQLHAGYPWRFSHSTLPWRSASPRLGEDTEQILRDELDLTPEEIAELYELRVAAPVQDHWDEQVTADT